MAVIRAYGVSPRISENEYYTRTRNSVNNIPRAKVGSDLKGIEDAIAEGTLRPISHVMMKAAHFTMIAVGSLHLDRVLRIAIARPGQMNVDCSPA
jgi:hypothetical protein